MVDRRFDLYRETLLLSRSEVLKRKFHAKIKERAVILNSMAHFIDKTINAEGIKLNIIMFLINLN
jgi:hypothetical protein